MADLNIVFSFVSCFLVVNSLFSCFFLIFVKGSGDTSENGERVVDSHMQIRLIACGYPISFAVCKRIVDSLLKCFSEVVDTLLKEFACRLHYILI
jgi:hypothetical protein